MPLHPEALCDEGERDAAHDRGDGMAGQQAERQRAHERAQQTRRDEEAHHRAISLVPQLLDADRIHDQQQRQHDGRRLGHRDGERHQGRGERTQAARESALAQAHQENRRHGGGVEPGVDDQDGRPISELASALDTRICPPAPRAIPAFALITKLI